ncbi:MAG: N-acetyl-gamma-glutamyl-phosphate reductase [Leptospiraceae bacterium]|nr:MAG: N-acetyl-gamma-glutamyl-phosphate reductase [Leptospiraceae bacterium]
MTEVGIIGAGGLTGKELLKILNKHSNILPVHITSNQFAGKKVKEVFPDLDLNKIGDLKFSHHEDKIPDKIPLFLATPNKESMELVYQFYKKEKRIVIDLSGSYRIDDLNIFQKVYGFKHQYPDIISEKVYGLTEIYREQIRKASLVANPGCYPTSILIPLYYFKDNLKYADNIIIDSKSGVSGAGGRVEDAGFSFQNIYENFRAYKILKHQHEPEIFQYLNNYSGFKNNLIFTPHLLPVFRGILSTIVIIWQKENQINDEEIYQKINQHIQNEPFVRLFKNPEEIELKNVQNTNYCDFSFRTRENTTIIISAIDNLMKGAAGQAIQNLNLILNYKEEEGLK